MPEPGGQNAQPTNAPTNKTLAATGGSAIGAAIATIVLYLTGWDKALPPHVATAVTAVIAAAVAFISSYLTPHGPGEGIMRNSSSGRVVSVR